MFQSTPPHGGRPRSAGAVRRLPTVSIHAPARGATAAVSMPRRVASFNPRPRTGGDAIQCAASAGRQRVSIHAPARGATSAADQHRGMSGVFQSTPPHGGRPSAVPLRSIARRFNPRPRTGGDIRPLERVAAPSRVSIHAPARGATVEPLAMSLSARVSIHAPARGATDRMPELRIAVRVSIHAPARGATTAADRYRRRQSEFQSTPPHGGRPATGAAISWSHCWFQSTPPHGGRLCLRWPEPDTYRFQSTPPHGGRLHSTSWQSTDRVVSIHAPARGATAAMRRRAAR